MCSSFNHSLSGISRKKSTKHSRKTWIWVCKWDVDYSPDLRWRLFKTDQAPHKADCTWMQLCSLHFITTQDYSSLVCDLAPPSQCFGIWLHPLGSLKVSTRLLLLSTLALSIWPRPLVLWRHLTPISLALWSSTHGHRSFTPPRIWSFEFDPTPLAIWG